MNHIIKKSNGLPEDFRMLRNDYISDIRQKAQEDQGNFNRYVANGNDLQKIYSERNNLVLFPKDKSSLFSCWYFNKKTERKLKEMNRRKIEAIIDIQPSLANYPRYIKFDIRNDKETQHYFSGLKERTGYKAILEIPCLDIILESNAVMTPAGSMSDDRTETFNDINSFK